MKNGNWWFLRLQWPFGCVFACLWKQKWDFSAGKWTGTWEVTTFGDSISAKKDYFQQKTEICPLDWGDVQSKSVGQCVISVTARARAPDAIRVWCFILLLACKSLVVSFASPYKLYLRNLLQWGNYSLLKSTAQRAGTQTMRWKHVSDTVIALLV